MNRLTNVEVGKKNKDRLNLYIDNSFAFSIDKELFYKENLQINNIIDKEKIMLLVNEDDYIKCKNFSLRSIQRSYKTEKQLVDKLKLKEFNLDSIMKTINFLKEYNFLNDDSYVKNYIKEKLKVEGINKIKYSLKRKGLDDEIINKHLDVDSNTYNLVAYKLCSKKYNLLKNKESDKYKIKQKLYRFLLSKGYDYETSSSVIKDMLSNDN